MKTVFICAPFRGKTQWEIEQNVRAVERAMLEVAELGFAPIGVQSMYRHFHGEGPDEAWLEICNAVLLKSDIVLVVGNRLTSGMVAEMELASKNGVRLCKSIAELQAELELDNDTSF